MEEVMRNVSGHTATVGEIVGRLLQLWDPQNPLHNEAQATEIVSLIGFDQEEAEHKLSWARQKGHGEDAQRELESRLQQANEHIETAGQIERDLLGEIEIFRQAPDRTTLVVIVQHNEQDCYGSEEVSITTKSLYQWAKTRFEIEVPEWAPAVRNIPELEDALASTSRYTNLEKDKHLIIIAGLLEHIADAPGGKYGEKGIPNCKAIADKVADILNEDELDRAGFSMETLRDRFSEALKAKKEHCPEK
jgi:hypothetical protein